MLRFLSLDFETTGLDTKKDDPIQIGLVIFDREGKILASFSSLIQPSKSIKELKEIVQYVTGFDLATLQYAPKPKEVFAQVAEYLTDDLIIVGHNISFDIAILKRFLPDWKPRYSIDTFDCARQLLHFQQSYALDALIQLDQQQQLGIFQTIPGKAHDALYDATASMQLFLWRYTSIKKMSSKYPVLSSLLSKHEITALLFPVGSMSKTNYVLPPLHTSLTSNTKIIPVSGPYIHAESILSKAILPHIYEQQKTIIAVNHPSKIALIKSLLQQKNIVAFDSVHDVPRLNLPNSAKLLQKSQFSRGEIGFLIKYYAQYDKGHSLIDCKSVDDYKILNAITDLSSTALESLTICTHGHLRSFAHKITPDTKVIFMDADHRLSSYLYALQQPVDLLHLTNLADQVAYRYELEGNTLLHEICAQMVVQLSIFSARFHIYIAKYLTNTQATTMDCTSLEDDTLDIYARRLLLEMDAYIQPYISELQMLHQGDIFVSQWNRCVAILSEPFVIEKKTFGDHWFVLFHTPTHHVGYEDFSESLPKASYIWIKSTDDAHIYTKSPHALNQNFQSLNTILHKKTSLFLLCQSKPFSKGMFDRMMQHKMDQQYTILAENITGGTGKALLFAKKSKKPILMIGSENFYYAAIGAGLTFDDIGMRYYKPDRVHVLMADLQFYSLSPTITDGT